TADRARDHWRRDDLDVALLGAGRAIQTIASVLLMVDPRDLGLVTQVRSPHAEEPTIYLYEAVPGGIGLSERLWQRHDELLAGAADLIAGCSCDAGCPACTGPRLEPNVDAKRLALRLLAELGAPHGTEPRPQVRAPSSTRCPIDRARVATWPDGWPTQWAARSWMGRPASTSASRPTRSSYPSTGGASRRSPGSRRPSDPWSASIPRPPDLPRPPGRSRS